MTKFYPFIFLLFSINVFSQKVTIIDVESKQPIDNVAVFNENKTKRVLSNNKGIVDLSIFPNNAILTFSHISYIELEVLKNKLKKLNYKVFLTNKAESLQEVFLVASKGKEQRNRIAEQLEGVSYKNIQKLNPQTTADMLADIPGVKVQKSQFGGGSPVLRGMEANRVLLVIDGVRMNNAIYRKGHLQNSITVSPTQLERTEVIFGPSSVIYGSDALGGVIQYYTKTPMLSDLPTINANYLTRFSTVNNGFTSQFGAEISRKKWASYTSIAYSTFGNLKMGTKRSHGFKNWGKQFVYSNNSTHFFNDNPVVNSNPNIQHNVGFHQMDLLQKIVLPLSEKTKLNFNLQYSTSSDIPRFDKLTELKNGNLKFAEWYYGPQDRLLLSSQIELNPNKSILDNGTITFAYQNIKESRINRKFGSLKRTVRNENVDVYSVNADFFVSLTKKEDRILAYGFEIAYNDVNSLATGETLNISGNKVVGFSKDFFVQSRYPDGGSNYLSTAAYLDYRQTISKKATLNTGVRFTNTHLHANWINQTLITLPNSRISLNNAAVTLTAGYIYKPAKIWQINMVLSSGFRSPNIDDIGKVREKKGKVTVPNTSLKPEFAYNVEVGLLKYFNDKKAHLGFTAYYMLLNHYITREPFILNGSSKILFDGELADVVANVNKNNAYVTGATFELKTPLYNNLIFKTSLTYTKGRTYDTNLPLSSIPPLFGNVSLTYTNPKYELSIFSRFNGRKKLKNYNLTEGIDNIDQTPFIINKNQYYGTPAWITYNFYLKYKISKSIDFELAVNNILDQHYKEFASSISAPGRDFSISLIGIL